MPLNEMELRARLAPRAVQFHATVDSTNDLAQDWLHAGAPNGAVVIADEQRRGRGRMGRVWYTPPDSALVVSVILHPPPDALYQMTMLGALSIYDMITSLGAQDMGIKWPNDVRLNQRKVSGVLPEAVWDGDQLRGVVLGMGVNVNVDFSTTELAATAISINHALGHPFDRIDLIASLLEHVDKWSAHLGSQFLFETWKTRLITLGKQVTVQQGADSLTGFAEAVDTSGTLIVRDENGTMHSVPAGDVLLASDSE